MKSGETTFIKFKYDIRKSMSIEGLHKGEK